MEVTTIIYIIIAFVIGIVMTYIICKKSSSGHSVNDSRIAELTAENESLKAGVASAEKVSSQKAEEIKSKYEALLNEAKAQCDKLDAQLKNALDGKLDDSIKEQLADAEKLKKKIKSLEEEIEENEDDISDLKKKLKNKETDLADLQENFDKEQKVSKELREELTSVKQELDDKIEELKLKMGSLEFIQAILSAKEHKTKDINNLNKKIDIFESFVKGTYFDLNADLYKKFNKNGFEKDKKQQEILFDQWAATKRKSWLYGKTTIAFVGEFSAGKTSIVNRILSQDNPNIPQLPVSAKATTAIPTYIAGGPYVTYSFISGDAKRKEILEETFKKVSKESLDQVKGVSSLIKYFVMTYENPNLTGLSILDTPGFNSNDSEDKERTIDVINECDALFWVFDVNAGTVNRSSISIIKERLNKPLYVVINKVDTKAESEVKKVEDLIKKTLSDAGLRVQQYIHFSSKAPLESIMNPIKGVKKDTARDTFVSNIEKDLTQIKKIIEGEVKSSRDNYNDAVKKGNILVDQFVHCMQELQHHCDTACGIPRWVTHTFSKDRYEMTADEGYRLINLLDEIANTHVRVLAEKYDDGMDNAANQHELYSCMRDAEELLQRVNKCYEQYKKVSKDL